VSRWWQPLEVRLAGGAQAMSPAAATTGSPAASGAGGAGVVAPFATPTPAIVLNTKAAVMVTAQRRPINARPPCRAAAPLSHHRNAGGQATWLICGSRLVTGVRLEGRPPLAKLGQSSSGTDHWGTMREPHRVQAGPPRPR
jgi:hypothetical protein